MRIEWCEARARANRFSEEIELVEEEMRRTLAFLEWQAQWWRNQGGDLTHIIDSKTREGLLAYRERQSALRLGLRDRFQEVWKGVPKFLEAGRAELATELERIKTSVTPTAKNLDAREDIRETGSEDLETDLEIDEINKTL